MKINAEIRHKMKTFVIFLGENSQKTAFLCSQHVFLRSVALLFLENACARLPLESAKKFRTITFYNKELKLHIFISQINVEKLKISILLNNSSHTKGEALKKPPRASYRKIKFAFT